MTYTEARYGVPLIVSLVVMIFAAGHLLARSEPVEHTRVLGAVVTPEPQPQPSVVEAPPVVEVTPAPAVAEAPKVAVRSAAAPRPRAPRAPRVVAAAPAAAPFRGWVELPSIGTRGTLVKVGLDKNGNMVTPRGARNVAWLDTGTFPGPTRNAILAGHRNWSGASGTFERLEQMKEGDQIRVGINDQMLTFVVRWVRTYDPDNAPVEELLGPTEVDSVTLVTCGGDFNRRKGHYEKRVVARAELVSG